MENLKTENKTIANIFKGVLISLIASLILLLIFSILLTYTNISETAISPVIIIITAISIMIGSSIGNNKIRKNGILNGGIIGMVYILIIYIISSLLNWRFSLNLQSLIMISISVIFGMIGGIIGVNKNRTRKFT